MKTRFIYFVICLILVNCKDAQPELIRKYSEKPNVINCDIENAELFNEAIYSFETILIDNYANKNPNLTNSYRVFLKESTNNTANYNAITNEHALAVFEALKSVDGLWMTTDNKMSPNYKHPVFSCIGENIQDTYLKATYNALLTTNSMSMRMLKDVLIAKSSRLNTDKYLATFVALELYYSKLSDVDLSQKQPTPTEKHVKENNDPHAGHNHD
ncbi:MAG: hypothetical protein KDD05_02780 [Psychroserpens sp.]|nr:hypothetical protein [Psychroserpens sp.]